MIRPLLERRVNPLASFFGVSVLRSAPRLLFPYGPRLCPRPDILLALMERNLPGSTQRAHVCGIVSAFWTQAMVKMRSGQGQIFERPQGQKQAEQGRGINPAGKGE